MQVFLFLQGPISPFFAELGAALEHAGHRVLRVNVNLGDWLFWRLWSDGAGRTFNYRGTSARWPAWIAALMAREGVTDLILLGEQRFYQRAAIAAAKDCKVAVSVTDFGYLRPDWITLERDGMSGDSRLPRTPEAIRALARQAPPADLAPRYTDDFGLQATWDVVFHIASMLGRPLYPFYRSYHIHHPVLNYLGTGWRLLRRSANTRRANEAIADLKESRAPYWILPMQMEVDFSIRAYSPYPDMVTPLREVIGSFARHAPGGDRLMVRLHPLDPGVRNWRRLIRGMAEAAGVAGRVLFTDGGSLDALLAGARGVVTVNSTVGVWSIRAGIPTKTLGQAVFNIEGLVCGGTLDAFWQNPTPPDPALVDDFVRAIADTIQLRGVYYHKVGRRAGVFGTMERLRAVTRDALDRRLAEAATTTAVTAE
jgi:capsular polysaccharide export protein